MEGIGSINLGEKGNIKSPSKNFKIFVVFLSVLTIIVGGFLIYKFFPKVKEIPEKYELTKFELFPKIADAAGIDPKTSFILKTNIDLNANILKKYIKITPDVDFYIKKISSTKAGVKYELIPLQPLKEDTIYSIVILKNKDIAKREYSWAYQVKAPFQVVSSLPRDRATYVPTNTAVEITFNRENLVNPKNYFEISPDTKGEFIYKGNKITFIPYSPLKEKYIYTVKIKKGLKSKDTNDILSKDYIIRFETGEEYKGYRIKPYFSFERTFWEFQANTEPTFSIIISNLKNNSVLARVYKFKNASEFTEKYKSAVKEEIFWSRYNNYIPVFPSNKNKIFEGSLLIENQSNVKFLKIPKKIKEGFYMIDVIYDDNKHSQAWFQVTPYVGFIALSSTKSIVWIKNLNTQESVKNAAVEFENSFLGKTNADGVLMFDTPSEIIGREYYSYYPRYFINIKVGDKELVIPIETNYGYFPKLSPPDKFWDYLSVDKPVYGTSDRIRFWGIIKQRNGEDVRGQSLRILLTKPYWSWTPEKDILIYGQTEATIDNFYTLSGEIEYSNLKPGVYQLVAKYKNEIISSRYINIQPYIKPAYKLTITPKKSAIFAGDKITYEVSAEFFDGTPVRNLKVKYQGYFNKSIEGILTLNDEGKGEFTLNIPYYSGYSFWPRYLGVSVRPVLEEEGEISAESFILVFGASAELNIEQIFKEKSSSFNISLNEISLDDIKGTDYWLNREKYIGPPMGFWEIGVKLEEVVYEKKELYRSYDPIEKVTYPVYSYTPKYIFLRNEKIKTDNKGKAFYEFYPEEGKTYRITFSTYDRKGREITEIYYVYGAKYSYFGYYDPSGVEIKDLNEKDFYKIGDTINARLQYIGGNLLPQKKNGFLFIKISNGIIGYQISSSSTYNDRFKKEYIPNLELIGVFYSGKRFVNSPPLNFSFDAEERKLKISIQKDKEKYSPGEEVLLRFKVTDKFNNPKQAKLNVYAIDESLYSIRKDRQDIIKEFYKNIYPVLIIRSSHFSPLEGGAEKGGCFLGNTKILTPYGEKNIKNLTIGDVVYSSKTTDPLELEPVKIKRKTSHLVFGYLVINNVFKITPNHRLWINGNWDYAGKLKIGDILLNFKGEYEKVKTIKFVPLWIWVYNIELEKNHTYFAQNIYVHNEEKGEGFVRESFKDVALFKNIETDSAGRSYIKFKLPDNLTSWRVNVQGISKDLYVGKSFDSLIVGLPFFVDVIANKYYLEGDNVILKIRTFSSQQSLKDKKILYEIESNTLPFKKITRQGGRIIDVDIGKMIAGNHKIKVSASIGNYKDTVIKEINVVKSYFSQKQLEFYRMSPDISLSFDNKKSPILLITSYERGRFYYLLKSFLYQNGMRIEKSLSNYIARIYLNRYYNEDLPEDISFDFSKYQENSGAISMFPYGGKNLEITAKIANLLPDLKDTKGIAIEPLKEYLYKSLSDEKSDIHRIAISLYGLSALKEPVLTKINLIKNDKNLSLKDKIYIALSLSNLGAKEDARKYYIEEIKPNLVDRPPYIFLNKFKDEDENIVFSSLVAVLASSISEPEETGIFNFVMDNHPKNTLNNLEILLYLQKTLPKLKNQRPSFTFVTSERKKKIVLENNRIFKLALPQKELNTLRFKDIKGNIGIILLYEKDISYNSIPKDSSVGVIRKYYVNGRQTNDFKEGDLIKIVITPTFSSNAIPGTYEIIDYLPSGLRPITKVVSFYERNLKLPFVLEHQKVRFLVSKDYNRRSFYYYARIVSKGKYKAEPTLIQSLKSPAIKNISNSAVINIK